MSTETKLQVAKTIKQQLMHYDQNLMMCLGSNNFVGSEYNDKEKHNGFLQFNIQNLRDMNFGTVRIELNYKDTYNITIYKGTEYELFATANDIYEDGLTSVLENLLGH